ncbi:MAG: helix-turn-helix domain-containing protein [Candidatus Poribacteria bacterium]|nr:helix-turn-helix domain-containing protein [Candidatus Poribacteria bacterium]
MPIGGNDQVTVVKESECGVTITMQVIGGKWKMPIIHTLSNGLQRFSALKRLIPDVTQKMLVQQLRELESHGIVNRKVYAVVPPKVEYSLTEYGKTLAPILELMHQWGEKHASKTKEIS